MKEYRITGVKRSTGKPAVDQMRADNEDEAREMAERLGIDVQTIDLKSGLSPKGFDQTLLMFGYLVSLFGCLSPLIYLFLVASGDLAFTGWGLFVSIVGGLYCAAMRLVFLRAADVGV